MLWQGILRIVVAGVYEIHVHKRSNVWGPPDHRARVAQRKAFVNSIMIVVSLHGENSVL